MNWALQSDFVLSCTMPQNCLHLLVMCFPCHLHDTSSVVFNFAANFTENVVYSDEGIVSAQFECDCEHGPCKPNRCVGCTASNCHYCCYTEGKHSLSIISERQVTFTFSICRRPSVCLSVCRLQGSCGLCRRLKFSAMFLRHLVPWP